MKYSAKFIISRFWRWHLLGISYFIFKTENSTHNCFYTSLRTECYNYKREKCTNFLSDDDFDFVPLSGKNIFYVGQHEAETAYTIKQG